MDRENAGAASETIEEEPAGVSGMDTRKESVRILKNLIKWLTPIFERHGVKNCNCNRYMCVPM